MILWGVMDYIHPDLALFLAALFVLGVFLRLFFETSVKVRGFGWIFFGISLFLVASFFNWFEETPLGYLMLEFTDEEGWDFIVPVFGYAPGGLMFCIGFAEWLRMAFILKKEVEQRQIAEQELKASLAEADKANAAKDKFLSSMSHELRTPLTAIIGFSEIMSDPNYRQLTPSEYADYSEVILRSSNHLLQTIDDILSLTEVDAHEYQLNEEQFDTQTIVSECFYLLAVEAEKAGVKLKKTGPDPLYIEGDKRLFKQIVLNLVSNGIKFGEDGGWVKTDMVVDQNRGFIFEVEDSGSGMTPDEAKGALEPFTQFEDPLSRKTSGTGVGLTLVKRFVEMHGGKLEITSQKGKGTTVQAVLPLVRAMKAQQKNAPQLGRAS